MGDKATALYTHLIKEWHKGPGKSNDAIVKKALAELKIELSQLGLLFPSLHSNTDLSALKTAREVLEIGAFQSIRSKDVPSFERYVSLLSSYYVDLSKTLPKSPHEASLTGLSLLKLLSQNRIAEFHTLLETLHKDIVETKEVGWVISLERSLMEGSYSLVWRLCSPSSSHSLPVPDYAYFVSPLIETVRNEIASCDEKAYATLPVRDAKTLLFFDTEKEVELFAKARGWYLTTTKPPTIHFQSSPHHPLNTATSQSKSKGIPSALSTGLLFDGEGNNKELDKEKVVAATLAYARELESIV